MYIYMIIYIYIIYIHHICNMSVYIPYSSLMVYGCIWFANRKWLTINDGIIDNDSG